MKNKIETVSTVTLMCPNLKCRKILAVPSTSRGTRVRCSYCGTTMFVPWSKPVPRPNPEKTETADKNSPTK